MDREHVRPDSLATLLLSKLLQATTHIDLIQRSLSTPKAIEKGVYPSLEVFLPKSLVQGAGLGQPHSATRHKHHSN